ncbi:hypothetical protein [Solilutibacter silvestris]|uniref:hypothetical protein n=1 Tax=Solilutibacter silvestris TaxID=1645665 RepID=UPI003D34092D
MSFDESIQRVKRAELALDASTRKVTDHWQQLRQTWRDAWTPGRIVVAGIASGFVVGRGELPTATGSGFINLVSAVSGLFAVDQAGEVAEVAGDAVDQVQQVAEAADVGGVVAEDEEPVRAYEALRRSGAW